MNLKLQKRLAGLVMKCSSKRVKLDPSESAAIKESITKKDIGSLIAKGLVTKVPKRSVSRVRARKILVQKRKGLRRGAGSREGKFGARLPSKTTWVNKIRVQREFLKELKDKKMLDTKTYRNLYLKSKGGFFRSRRHIKIYITDNKLVQENGKQ